jgi:hypothetical protein
MLLQRSDLAGSVPQQEKKTLSVPHEENAPQPLTCMFYFFASQMKHNVQSADPDLVARKRIADKPTHKLDNMLAWIGMQAAYSPLVASFETYPVEIPDAPGFGKNNPKPSREQVHDTVLMMKFRDKRAREEWIATREWQDFMKKSNADPSLFRRMPHVRCASSAKGLMDPIDVLTL